MARAREFDEVVATARAMELFWQKGYRASSLGELLEVTGLSRSSLYETFGTKRGVLLAALSRYADVETRQLIKPLLSERAGRAEIEATLMRIVEFACKPGGQRGCLVNNCATEIAPHDTEVMKVVRSIRLRLHEKIEAAVARGQKDGTIASRKEPFEIAVFLLNTISGLHVTARTRPGRSVMENIANVALSVLDQ